MGLHPLKDLKGLWSLTHRKLVAEFSIITEEIEMSMKNPPHPGVQSAEDVLAADVFGREKP